MRKFKLATVTLTAALVISTIFYGCGSSKLNPGDKGTGDNKKETSQTTTVDKSDVKQTASADNTSKSSEQEKTVKAQEIDLAKVKPNEAGKIMIVMFHNFVETYKSGDKSYTTTFAEFRKLLDSLYAADYRLISLNDFIDNKIDVPAGCIPIVFTFDDGTAGQFNLVNDNGNLAVNKQSAVGIMEEFSKEHPDFGLKGTFYVNLGCAVFPGEGTVQERLAYLTGKGFEIGNHTLDHVNLKKVKTAEEVQKEIGGNQKELLKILPDYTFATMSLPYGAPAKDLKGYVEKGEYEGLKYVNKGIMEVGWDPSVPPASRKFNPLSIHRVRASGIAPVEADLGWWLNKLSRAEQYVSDGDPDKVTIPKGKEALLDPAKLGDRQLVVY